MKLDFANERVLAVVAHPDDAELLCAGTLARARADGAVIGIAVLCRGDKGQPDPPIENLGDVRSGEMQAAAELLHAELLEGGFGDGELFDSVESRRTVVELLRQFRATLVLAHSADDYHADHRAASAVSEAASWFCASAGHKTESAPLAQPPALWWMDTVELVGFQPEFYVDVSEFVELKRQMVRCHQSQLARGENAGFSPLEEIMIRQSEARGAQAGAAAAEAFQQASAWKRTGAW
ncbi:MAG: PIG-L deacetylase family protein [Pirellulaceae bacterium]|nr:PIG-L deacetylase family protein [Pirellulaceae bacterium]MDP6553387.1 PIG-L deacetylase family protein [Pirellulaceae bacterium]MDP6718524.1 PIG-L deacetylase family protein [Pirellulaceae bacterium]